MPVQVQMPQRQQAGIEGLLGGLQALHTYYGIKQAAAANDEIQRRSDPNSPQSIMARNEALASNEALHKQGVLSDDKYNALQKAILGNPADPTGKGGIPPMSALDLDRNPQMNPAMEIFRTNVQANSMHDRFAAQNETRRQQQVMNVAKTFENDPVIKGSNQIDAQATKDLNTLYNRKEINPQTLAELQKGLANMVSGGNSSALGTENRQIIETTASKLADLQQKLQNKIVDVNSPQILGSIADSFQQMQLSARKNRFDRAQALNAGNSLNPMNLDYVQNVIDAKTGFYKNSLESHPAFKQNTIGGAAPVRSFDQNIATQPPASQNVTQSGGIGSFLKNLIHPSAESGSIAAPSGPQAHPQDNEAVSWARQNLNDPNNSAKAQKILQLNGVQ